MSDTEPTCGKGLAANAVLPSKLSELLEAQATVLDRHIRAIDQADPNATAEIEAYTRLAQAYHAVARDLGNLANEMASYAALPMPRHDPSVMMTPGGQMDAFRAFVALETELVSLLTEKVKAETALLNSVS